MLSRLVRFLEKAANIITAISVLLTVLAAAFTWLGAHLEWLRPYGWAEAVVFGVLMTVTVAIAAALVLLAWRRFRPITSTSLRTPAPTIPPPLLRAPGAVPSTATARQGKFYSAAEKERIGDMLYALSEALLKHGGAVMANIATIDKLQQGHFTANFEAIAIALQGVNDNSGALHRELFSEGLAIKDNYPAYVDEFWSVIPRDSKLTIQRLQIARNVVAEGVQALRLAVPLDPDGRLLSGILGVMAPARDELSKACVAYKEWLEGCRKRLDTLRLELR